MWFVVLPVLLALPLWDYAQPLRLEYGVNKVDINADGVDDMIVRTRWDVESAHSADKYMLAIAYGGNKDYLPKGYYDVGFEQDNAKVFWTSEGADCVLSGYVFRLNAKKLLEMDYYHRDFGESYADSQPVTVTTYRLAEREDAALRGMGLTPYYLRKVGEHRTSKKYCDVRGLMK